MTIHINRRRGIAMLLAAAVPLSLAACSSNTPASASSGAGADNGAPVTMWVRATTASQSKALVDAYNVSHKPHVELTVVPTDSYLQKVGVAAGAKQLPCLMASDVVYMPNFIEKGLYLDITDRVNALPYKDKLASISSVGKTIYGVPHNVAVSAIFQNDVLLEKAGIDPKKPLTSLHDLAANATKVAGLGNGAIGLYYTGGSASSIAFTHFPAIWASGGEPLSADGTKSLLDSSISTQVFKIFNDMYKAGVTPDTVPSETGATRDGVFATGKVGYMLASNSVLQTVPDNANVKVGVQGIPGLTGGESTFVGGDSIGITSTCSNSNSAWNFISWSLSKAAQVDIYAKMHQLPVRSDLADNKYATGNAGVLKLNQLVGEGKTPYAPNFGQSFNDPNGPALSAFQDALFGKGDPVAVLKAANPAITASLKGQ